MIGCVWPLKFSSFTVIKQFELVLSTIRLMFDYGDFLCSLCVVL